MDLSVLTVPGPGRHSERTAVESGGRSWSYGTLDRVTRERASRLRRHVGGDGRVALAGEHTPEALLWALAVLRSGLVYIPFNPDQPAARTREALDLAAPSAILCCSERSAGTLRDAGVTERIVRAGDLDALGDPDALDALDAPGTPVPGDRAAYSVFTSGSTGVPKLVNVGHRGLAALCRAQTRIFGLEPGQRVLQFSSLAFDASIAELLVTLHAGATLVVPEWDGRSWVHAVGHHLREHGCDLVTLPPSVYARLDDRARRGIRTVVFAGEALPEPEFRSAIRHSRVLNAYGPTEGTVCFSVAEPTAFSASIGRPIEGFSALVHRAGPGGYSDSGPGELVLVGDGVALGYEGEAGAGGPFTTVGGRPAYHTGDRVELRDGEIFYLGRVDDQVKRLGHRIDLAGLRAGLSRLLDGPVAVLVDDGALVLAHTSADRPEPELRSWLREVLPSWEVPDVLLEVPEIPVTDTGKADLDALRALGRAARPGPAAAADPTASGVDPEVVRAVVEKILGTPVELSVSVFDVGASSLNLVQIQTELAEMFGEDPVQDAFDRLDYDFTVEAFVVAIGDDPAGGAGPPAGAGAAVRAVFDTVSADLDHTAARLRAVRPGSPADPGPADAVTVTGAAGFVGGHVLDRLLDGTSSITVVTTSSPQRLVERHRIRFGRTAAEYGCVRFLGYDEIGADGPDAGRWGRVVHCGFDVNHVLPLARHVATSVASTRTLLEAAAARDARRFVLLSAASVGERFVPFTPDALAAIGDPYSQAKFVAETFAGCLDDGSCRVDLLRAGLVYGHNPGDAAFLADDVFATLLRLSRQHRILPRLAGPVPVCHVDDVVTEALAADVTGNAAGRCEVLVRRTYDLDELRAELALEDAEVLAPADWLRVVTGAGTADPRLLAALRQWLGGAGWSRPVRATGRAILGELLPVLEAVR